MSKLKVSKRWHWPLSLALATALLASGQDNKRQQTSSQPVTPQAQKTPSTAGVRVFIDPVTGAIREPEPEELQSLSPPPAVAVAAPQQFKHPNGAVGALLGEDQMVQQIAKQTADSADLQLLTHPSGAEGVLLGEDQMVFSVVTIGPDGKVKMECITGKNNAETKVKAAPRTEATDVR
jgi:hypothetical protein